jgi:hypothetical protein
MSPGWETGRGSRVLARGARSSADRHVVLNDSLPVNRGSIFPSRILAQNSLDSP